MPKTKLEIRTILDDVVHQFSDPLAFFRELVQNSIDAGTGDIEIEFAWTPSPEDPSKKRIEISVRDWGEGMTRRIIETKLVRLFSSGKDDDLTKIGRFGIGFVSVFAIDPEMVAVDTGREGEHWRVLFSQDRTYELFALDHPVEGTHVRVFKDMDEDEAEKMSLRARDTIIEWCKHAEVPIRFNGEEIRQEFDIPSGFTTTYQEQGTRIVMGFLENSDTVNGYYNRGLTLKETSRSPWPWATFKIDSRYLEHTLTRDQILEDRHFSKAMELLEGLATETLPEQLLEELVQLADPDRNPEESDGPDEAAILARHDQFCGYLGLFLSCDQPFARAWRRLPIFRTLDGEPASFRDVRRGLRRHNVHLTRNPNIKNPVLDGAMVLVGSSGLRSLVRELFEEVPDFFEDNFLDRKAAVENHDPDADSLRTAIVELLADVEESPKAILFVPASSLPFPLHNHTAIAFRGDGDTIPRTSWRTERAWDVTELAGPDETLIINTTLDEVRRLMRIAEDEPEWAALAMIENLLNNAGDDELLRRAVERRMERLGQSTTPASRTPEEV